MAPKYLFDLDRLGASRLVLLTFLGLALTAAFLYGVGVVGWAVRLFSLVVRTSVRAGFWVWRQFLSWAPWQVFLPLVGLVLALGIVNREVFPPVAIACSLVLLLSGVATCLAYVFIDLERYEVARGYMAIHEPMPGQQLAINLVRYGGQVGVPLLASAAVAVVTGFALLNQELYETVGPHWYRLGRGGVEPDYEDFLTYTLINLFGVVDVLDLANTYNYVHASYVRQARWPASSMLFLFKSFFTVVLLQQIFASVRRGKLLSETIADFWSPHPPIHERARGSLPQFGPDAVWPLLRSLRPVATLTAEQREHLPRIIADVGPAALPALLQHLHDPSDQVRTVAVASLGRLHVLDALPQMISLEHDPADGVRQALAEALGELTGPTARRATKRRLLRRALRASGNWLLRTFRRLRSPALPPSDPQELALATLRAALADPTPAVRAEAAASLGKFGPRAEAAGADLIRLLRDEDETACLRASQALGQIGVATPEAVAALVGLLEDHGTPVRVAAAQALGAMKKDAADAVPALTPLLLDGDEAVRAAVADALGRIGALEGRPIEEMTRGLESTDTLVRAQTAEALGSIGPAAGDAAPALAEALADNNDRVRAKAAEALGHMGEAAAEAVPQLVRALHDNDTWVSALAAEALGEIGAGPEAVPALVRSLRHANPQVRGNAAEALGKLGAAARPAAGPLALAVGDAEPEVRTQAVAALGEVGGPDAEVTRTLLASLDDPSPKVRAAAVEAVGKREGVESSTRPLLRATEDTSDEVKVQAARALGRVPAATPELLDALCRLVREGSNAVQIEAAQALGRLGSQAIPAGEDLLRLSQSEEGDVREQALRALAVIQPPQAAEAFLACLKAPRPEVRTIASAGLIKAVDSAAEQVAEAAATLVEALHDPEPQVRANAARVLSRLPALPEGAVEPLTHCAADPDDGVRLNAALALRLAPPDRTRDTFRLWLGDPTPRVRLLAAGHLLAAFPATAEAAKELFALLSDGSAPIRRSAVEAIRSLGPGGSAFADALRLRAQREENPQVSALVEEVLDRLGSETEAQGEPARP